MKKGHQAPTDNLTGREYWRSLDHMVETDEFRSWLDSEFPSAAQQAEDAPSRRHFMKIMSAGFMLAGFGLTGCRRPEELLIPFNKSTGDYIHGVAEFFATSRVHAGGASPLLAKSADGRPVKLERNTSHPDASGTSASTQASMLDLYDPDRLKKINNKGNDVTIEAGTEFLKSLNGQLTQSKGEGFAFLLDGIDSPSRDRLVKSMQAKFPSATWHQYNPLCPTSFSGSENSEGTFQPLYSLAKADRIVSIGSDFLGTEPGNERHTRDYAKGRKITGKDDKMNRLYVVEGPMTVTGASADHRLRLAPSQIEKFAYTLAFELITHKDFPEGALTNDGEITRELSRLKGESSSIREWATKCADDVLDTAHPVTSVIVPGVGQPPVVQALCQMLNLVLGNVGKTVEYKKVESRGFTSIELLANAISSGSVKTLVMVGGNPAYNAPADLKWSEIQSKTTVVRLTDRLDESSKGVEWSIPRSHFLEAWGDGRTADGSLVSVQPLIAPLYNSLSDIEFLAAIAGEASGKGHDIVRQTFAGIARSNNNEQTWRRFIHDGYLKDSYYRYSKPDFSSQKLLEALKKSSVKAEPSEKSLDVVFLPDNKIGAGEMANNGWLQELPDPITKITWDNVILMSPATAEKLGLPASNRIGGKYNMSRIIDVEIGDKKVTGPVWIQTGFADNTVGLQLGYARTAAGRVGNGVGSYNATAIRSFKNAFIAQGASISASAKTVEIACTQDHGSMEGRPIIREANLDQFQKHPNFANDSMGIASHFPHELPYKVYNHPYDNYEEKRKKQEEKDGTIPYPIIKSSVHQWAMTIDLNACTGCNACVVSCQAENNIPIVGKDQVRRGREMHWIRIDRYFSAPITKGENGKAERRKDENLPADPQVSLQPMACVQCENAPCESVCPVNATVHDEEGLNLMVYNRCVGTRYCSNNCPYKVRRFNFFDYNLRPLDSLYDSPVTGQKLPRRPEDEYELAKLARNPDVSARMRGVMEKCTYCVQRIEGAKINQKIKAGASGDVEVPDGTIKTACQDACPADAIIFGNKLDPESEVSQSIKNPRNYTVLGYLETLPRTTHLARVRNPNPNMPDYQESPFTTQEYFRKSEGDPFEHHGGDHHGDDHHGDAHKDNGSHDTQGKEAAH